jgi:two-component sensor histidine kinase
MLLLVLLPLGIIGGISLESTYSTFETMERASLQNAARQTAAFMDLFIQENLRSLGVLAKDPTVIKFFSGEKEFRGHARQRLVTDATYDPERLVSVGLLNMKGMVLLDSDPTREGDDQGAHACFRQALTSSSGTVSELQFDARTGRPLITFAHPIVSHKGKMLGVAVFRWDAAILQLHLRRAAGLLRRSERCLLVDSRNVLLADSHLSTQGSSDLLYRPVGPREREWIQQMQTLGRLPPTGVVKELVIPGFLEDVGISHDPDTVAVSVRIDSLSYRVIYLQSAKTFIVPLQAQVRNKAYFFFVTGLVVAVIALFVARFLIHPLGQLTQWAQAVSRDERNIVFETKCGGEIGELADALNVMVTNLKQREEALRKSRHTLGVVLDLAPVALVVLDREGNVCNINGRGQQWFGVAMGESFFKRCQGNGWVHQNASGSLCKPEELEEREVILGNETQKTWEEQLRMPDGMMLWLNLGAVSLKGVELGAVISAMDISELKASESRLLTTVQEKEVLLREVHHRVKNNLQVVYSMLALQARYVRNREDEDLFRQTQDRVRSMALVHERLYKADDFANVDFAAYVRELAGQLLSTYKPLAKKITLDTKIDPISIPIDRAVPCALILNELISNALKHAFECRDVGHVRVELTRVSGCRVLLRVVDNGCGWEMPNGDHAPTLGIQLIRALVSQLHAELRTMGGSGEGTTVEVEWTQEIEPPQGRLGAVKRKEKG